ncbi:MAG: hypothetical protein KGI57_03190, partial [Hyphomicrobiales bacterium]|nr:hypothetical protein [Hyphomicrobiales bacterium]
MALDLEDFERRLRASGGAGRGAGAKDDPLAELARLIGEDDPFADLLEAPPGPPPASAVPARKSAPTPRAAEPPTAEARWADADDGHGSSAFDEPSMPQGNRDASPEDEVRFDGATPARRAPARLGRRLAALAIVGLVGIVGAAGLKFTSLSPWPKTAPFIAADSTPVRVPPPKAAPSLDDGAGPSVTAPATPTAKTAAAAKLAKDVEQPVDLGALAKSITGGEVPSQAAADAMFPATQTVQTVSVRPDGSLIAPPAAPTAPDAAAPAVPAPADAAVDLRASAAQDAGTVPAPAAASAPALPSPA